MESLIVACVSAAAALATEGAHCSTNAWSNTAPFLIPCSRALSAVQVSLGRLCLDTRNIRALHAKSVEARKQVSNIYSHFCGA
jgi:hypothetical protein